MSHIRVFLLVVATTLLSSRLQSVDACSCQPAHPQDQFCRSDFVVKALVGRAKLVELGDDGEVIKYIKDKKHTRNIGPRREDRYHDSEKINGESELDDEEIVSADVMPAPVVVPDHLRVADAAAARGPDSRMPGYNQNSAGLRGTHPVAFAPGISPNVRDRPTPRRRRNSVQKSRGSRRRLHGRRGVGDAPGAIAGPATPQKRIMIQYKINVVKVFKGLENVTKDRKNFLYTPPVPLCDVKFTSDRSPHIIMGRMRYGVMTIQTCDYKVDLSEMTESQSKNLIRNMHFRFKSGCTDCAIKVCNRGNCAPGKTNPYQCQWDEWWTVITPMASQFACIRAKNGKCKWYNSLEKSMTPEDISKTSLR